MSLKEEALRFHSHPTAGKISVTPTKKLDNQHDLSLAYSPGVAYACEAIAEDALQADFLTSRANLVAVISNGTAVLGLGDIGPLAGKPVMEGKGVLFKKFAGIDVFDIEIDETDPEKFIEIVASLEPTFGGINLEDIKAPECFEIETRLKERMKIPVFHDDQHGTAVIASAAVINALRLQNKTLDQVKVVASGAGAAGMACLEMFMVLGVKRENIIVCDSQGPIYEGRPGQLSGKKAEFVSQTQARTLAEALVGADVFLGVSKAGLVTGAMVKTMAAQPLILALANPNPEILPAEVHAVRDDAIVATGRSDYPNQVNNVLCFPYLFRGALDVGATEINDAMKMAACYALADLAQLPVGEEVIAAFGGQKLVYGKEYVIPKPFDPRLITALPIAVAKAAMESGVARRPITDWEAYKNRLAGLLNPRHAVMKNIVATAQQKPAKVVFAEGEEPRVLRAVLASVQENICQALVIGRREVIQKTLADHHLNLKIDEDFAVIDPENNPHFEQCWQQYHALRGREGVSAQEAQRQMKTQTTALAAMLVKIGQADTLICGALGHFNEHVRRLADVLGTVSGMKAPAALQMLLTPKGEVFIADTQIHAQPCAQELALMALEAAKTVAQFGLTPRLALVSHANFGDRDEASARNLREALTLIKAAAPELEVEGEMRADVALTAALRAEAVPEGGVKTPANVLLMPSVEAANISYHLAKALTDASTIGPIALGLQVPAQVVLETATARDIFNLTALAVAEIQSK